MVCDMGEAELGHRERKKQRTREQIVEASMRLFEIPKIDGMSRPALSGSCARMPMKTCRPRAT